MPFAEPKRNRGWRGEVSRKQPTPPPASRRGGRKAALKRNLPWGETGETRAGRGAGHKHQEPVVNREERSEIEGRWSD